MSYFRVSFVTALVLASMSCFNLKPTRAVGGEGSAEQGDAGAANVACPAPTDANGREVGEVVLPFTFENSSGQQVPLHDLCGDVVLIALGAGWCGACRDEMKELIHWQSEWEEEAFSIYYVVNQNDEGRPVDATFVREDWEAVYWPDGEPTFPVVLDPTSLVANTLAPSLSFPVVILIDRSMRIADVLGNPPLPQLKATLERMLAEP